MGELMKGLFWINKKLQSIEKFCGCVCLGVLFVIMIGNAALRYCLKSGLNWSDELNQFLFVWLGFLAAAYTMGDDKHLNVTAFVDLLPRVVQYVVRQIMNVIMLVFFLLYIPELFALMAQLPISNVLRVPMKYVYAVLPLSFGLMAFHILCNMIRDTDGIIRYQKERGKANV